MVSYRGLIAAPIRDVNDHLGLTSAAHFKKGSLLNDGHADAMVEVFQDFGSHCRTWQGQKRFFEFLPIWRAL